MPTILVADDNPGDRQLVKHHLTTLDAVQLVFASNGEEALAALDDAKPDVLLTDLRMPKMDGLSLVAAVHEKHPLLPIVLMTSFGNEQIAVDALNAGATSYVNKGHFDTELEETIRRVLKLAQSRRRRRELLQFFKHSTTRFVLENDPCLMPALVGFCEDTVRALGVCNPSERTHVSMALQEALDNALYHGNLEIDSELRQDGLEKYYALADERRTQDPYRARRITVSIEELPDRVIYKVADEGRGFDPSNQPDPTDPENMHRLSGRGLLLIHTFMDEVSFNDTGNEITMVKYNQAADDADDADDADACDDPDD